MSSPSRVAEPPALPEELVRPWLLPAVYERLRTGRGEFLAELRPAIPVFLRFGGIDYDNDDDAIEKLDEFVRAAQGVFNGYGGNVLQLTLGDKGAYLYGVFGSPLAHEDDAARAAAAALDLRDLGKTTAARDIQIGIAHGRLRSGTYGHEMRRTFVCLGDAVNLAARLMGAAPAERIYVAGDVREEAGEAFIWERLPDLTVKGKADPVEVWSLNGSLERASRRKTRFELAPRRAAGGAGRRSTRGSPRRPPAPRPGRRRSRRKPGMGKSRLVAEFVGTAGGGGLSVAFGECQAYGTSTAYFVWREIWRRLLRLEDDDPAAAPDRARSRRQLAAIDPDARSAHAAPRATSSACRSRTTTSPPPSTPSCARRSLEDLLADCLRARAATEPVVIVLEDCHWIDELSRDLLEVLVRVGRDCACCSSSPTGRQTEPRRRPRPRRRRRLRASSPLDRSTTTTCAELVRSKLAAAAGCRRRDRGRPAPRRPRHRPRRGQPVLRRGAAQLHRVRRASTRGSAARSRCSSFRTASTAWS